MVGWNGLKEIVAVNGDAFEFQVYYSKSVLFPRSNIHGCKVPYAYIHTVGNFLGRLYSSEV